MTAVGRCQGALSTQAYAGHRNRGTSSLQPKIKPSACVQVGPINWCFIREHFSLEARQNNREYKNLHQTNYYDYSAPGAYFITVCTANREKIFWNVVGADIIRQQNAPLSTAGKIVEQGIFQMVEHYDNVVVDKFCIMPDRIHLVLRIESDIDSH